MRKSLDARIINDLEMQNANPVKITKKKGRKTERAREAVKKNTNKKVFTYIKDNYLNENTNMTKKKRRTMYEGVLRCDNLSSVCIY